MKEFINRIQSKLNYLGLSSSIKCLFQTLIHLYYVFRFDLDKWHIQGGLNCSKRNQYIVNKINNLKAESVVDVGCGLGVILNELNAPKLMGLDNAENAIRAAKSLSKNNNIVFLKGDFDSIEDDYDVLIATNFLHSFDQLTIKEWICNTLKNNHIRYLIVDEINENAEGYKFKHKFIEFLPKIELVEKKDFVNEKRAIAVYKVL